MSDVNVSGAWNRILGGLLELHFNSQDLLRKPMMNVMDLTPFLANARLQISAIEESQKTILEAK